MSLVKLQTDLASYNLWANQRYADWLRQKPASELAREVASSYPSIRLTVQHIWETERAWLCYLQGKANDRTWGAAFEGADEELFQELLAGSAALADYAGSLGEAELAETRHYSLPWIGEIERAPYELIQHCLNHSTYHRGQIVTIARNQGWSEVPMTDYMAYLMKW